MKHLYTRKLSKYKKALLTTAVIVGLMSYLKKNVVNYVTSYYFN